MQPIKNYVGQELQWVSSKLPDRDYELRAGDEILARVKAKDRASLLIDTADGKWTFERRGMRRIITIQEQATQQEPVTVKQSISGNARLLFPDGREYKWQGTSFWRDSWILLNSEGTPLLHLKKSALALLEPAAATEPDVALLTALSWYLRRLKKQSDEEIAAVSVVTSM